MIAIASANNRPIRTGRCDLRSIALAGYCHVAIDNARKLILCIVSSKAEIKPVQ